MFRYTSLLLFIGLTYSQSTSGEKRKEVITEIHRNGGKKIVLVIVGEGLNEKLLAKHGFYDNGIQAFSEFYQNNQKDGKAIYWNKNDRKVAEGNYKSGMMNGIWIYYYNNGVKRAEGSFLNGDGGNISSSTGIPKNGRNGRWEFWYENEKQMERSNYEKEKLEGLSILYFPNGNKKEESTFKGGKSNGISTSWYENGNIRKKGQYRNDLEDGSWTFWDNSGQKIYDLTFSNGELAYTGMRPRGGYSSGRPKQVDLIQARIRGTPNKYQVGFEDFTGEIIAISKETGNKILEFEVKNGFLNGIFRQWYSDGTKRSEFNFINQEPNSRWNFLDIPPIGSSRDTKNSHISLSEYEKYGEQIHDKYEPVGLGTEWYSNGNKKYVEKYGSAGIKDGKSYYYHESGALRQETIYKDGLALDFTEWYSNGNKSKERHYISIIQKLYKDTQWYENGGKKSEGKFISNKKDGKHIFYDLNGDTTAIENYKLDIKNGLCSYYTKSFQFFAYLQEYPRTITYKDGKQHGKTTIYYDKVNKKMELEFVNDKQIGNCTVWYENGNKKEEGISSGRISSSSPTTSYFKSKLWTYWYENGNKKEEGNWNPQAGGLTSYHTNLKGGFWTYWYENGNKKEEVFYKGEDTRKQQTGVGLQAGSNYMQVGERRLWYENGKKRFEGDMTRGSVCSYWDENTSIEYKGKISSSWSNVEDGQYLEWRYNINEINHYFHIEGGKTIHRVYWDPSNGHKKSESFKSTKYTIPLSIRVTYLEEDRLNDYEWVKGYKAKDIVGTKYYEGLQIGDDNYNPPYVRKIYWYPNGQKKEEYSVDGKSKKKGLLVQWNENGEKTKEKDYGLVGKDIIHANTIDSIYQTDWRDKYHNYPFTAEEKLAYTKKAKKERLEREQQKRLERERQERLEIERKKKAIQDKLNDRALITTIEEKLKSKFISDQKLIHKKEYILPREAQISKYNGGIVNHKKLKKAKIKISGRVKPYIDGIKINLFKDGTLYSRIIANKGNGKYKIKGLPKGNYSLYAFHPKHKLIEIMQEEYLTDDRKFETVYLQIYEPILFSLTDVEYNWNHKVGNDLIFNYIHSEQIKFSREITHKYLSELLYRSGYQETLSVKNSNINKQVLNALDGVDAIEAARQARAAANEARENSKQKVRKKFTVTGIVQNTSGEGIKSVKLTIINEQGIEITVGASNKYGEFKFKKIPAGSYTLRGEHNKEGRGEVKFTLKNRDNDLILTIM